MYVDRESQNIIADKVENTANVFRIKLQRLWQATQEPTAAKDRIRREKFLSRVCFIMPIQRQGFAWTGQAEAS